MDDLSVVDMLQTCLAKIEQTVWGVQHLYARPGLWIEGNPLDPGLLGQRLQVLPGPPDSRLAAIGLDLQQVGVLMFASPDPIILIFVS